jgi:hypothetical protein
MRRSRPVIVRDRGASRGLREKGDGWACFGCGFSELFASFAQPIGGVHLALLLEIRRGCELLTHHDDDACAGHVKNIFWSSELFVCADLQSPPQILEALCAQRQRCQKRLAFPPMPDRWGQNINQRDGNNEKTNGKMQVHVRHNSFLLGLFGNCNN